MKIKLTGYSGTVGVFKVNPTHLLATLMPKLSKAVDYEPWRLRLTHKGRAFDNSKTFAAYGMSDDTATYSLEYDWYSSSRSFNELFETLDSQTVLQLLDSSTSAQQMEHGVNYYYIVHWLKGGGSTCDLNRLGSDGRALVHFAATKKAVELLQSLHVRGANLDLPSSKGETALHKSARLGDLPAAKFLIEHHVSLDSQDTDGNTPLHLAVEWKRLDMVELLCTSGARLDEVNKEGDAPVHLTTTTVERCSSFESTKFKALVTTLARAGANINLMNSVTSDTALHEVVAKGEPSDVKTLLDMGADPMITNKHGFSPQAKALERHGPEKNKISDLIIKALNKPAAVTKRAAAALTVAQKREMKELRLQTEALTAQVATLQCTVEEQGARLQAVAGVQDQCDQLQVQLKVAETALARQKEENERLQLQNTQLLAENSGVPSNSTLTSTEVATIQAQLAQLQEQVQNSEAALAAYQRQHEQLHLASASAARASAEDAATLAELRRSLETTQRRLADARRERDKITIKNVELRRQLESYEELPSVGSSVHD